MKYDEIKSLLMNIDDPVEKLELVLEQGICLPPIPDGVVGTEIKGCSSLVKIYHDKLTNKFYGFADSGFVRGVVSVILSMVQDKTPAQIRQMNLTDEFKELNLQLGSSRLMGVASIIRFLESL